MNSVLITGRLTKDPELFYTREKGTAISNIILAVPKINNKDNPNFIQVVVMGKKAENLAEFMSKGKQIGVKGYIQTRSYDAKDGTKRYVTEVIAQEIEYFDRRNKSEILNVSEDNS